MHNEKLSRHVGVIVDIHYPKKVWVGNLIMQMPPKGTIVTATGCANVFIENAVNTHGELNLKVFDTDPWMKGPRAKRARDWQLVSYLEFFNGQLFLFPYSYEHAYGKNFSDRIQDLLITAHQRGVRYEIITGED